jgi:hypothetical protein
MNLEERRRQLKGGNKGSWRYAFFACARVTIIWRGVDIVVMHSTSERYMAGARAGKSPEQRQEEEQKQRQGKG